MRTKIYFYENNAYNAVVFDQENGFYFMIEKVENIDLYAGDAAEQLKKYFEDNINNEMMDLSGLCNSNCVFAGKFTADQPEEKATLLAEYDDDDYYAMAEPFIEEVGDYFSQPES